MADPDKEEELKKMLQMIVGKIYADMTGKDSSEFDPRSLGERKDAYVGPSSDWNPKDTDARNISWELFSNLRGRNPPLSWAMWLEEQKQKKLHKQKKEK